jgi:hypothetical protein
MALAVGDSGALIPSGEGDFTGICGYVGASARSTREVPVLLAALHIAGTAEWDVSTRDPDPSDAAWHIVATAGWHVSTREPKPSEAACPDWFTECIVWPPFREAGD